MDRTFGRQAANVRATWPILAFIVGINLMSLVIMFFLVTPEPVQIIAVLSFAGSAVAGMGYVTYVLLNGLFGSR